MKKVLVRNLLTLFFTLQALSAWGGTWTSGNTTVTTSGSTITVSPKPGTNGAMADYSAGDAPWHSAVGSINNIIINEGVTHIGANAFYEFSSTLTINSITIPVSVKSFGIDAFNKGYVNIVYYAGTPNEWADIDFPISGSYLHSHPFSGGIVSDHKIYFYNQKTTETKIIVFTPGLTTIKQYAFYMAGNITDVHIPHSVTSIGKQAFYYCEQLCRISILNTSAPTTTGTDIFNRMKSGGDYSWLYLPTNASASTSAPGFKRLPWYDSTGSGKGAARIGYHNTDKCASSTGNNFSTPTGSKVYPVSGTVNGINWSLNNDGVLTFNGSGSITTSFVISNANDNQYPWYRLRYQVHKVIINGNISGLSNALQRFEAMTEVEIMQGSIPTASSSLPTFVFCDKTTLRIPLALIDDAKLEESPWKDMKLAISEVVEIDENNDNSSLLNTLYNKLSEPFNMRFKRSLTNASYNTFCSPVPLTAAQLDGADIRALESSTYNDATEELWLQFSDMPLSEIEAGVPYLIKPSSTISNPTFTDVEPSSIVVDAETIGTSEVNFLGVLKPTELEGGNKSILFLGAGNELFWPAATGNIKGMRAYFEIKEGSGARRALRARMSMDGHNAPTNFESIQPSVISSQKVLRDGKLYIMYKGQMYDVQGRRISD